MMNLLEILIGLISLIFTAPLYARDNIAILKHNPQLLEYCAQVVGKYLISKIVWLNRVATIGISDKLPNAYNLGLFAHFNNYSVL